MNSSEEFCRENLYPFQDGILSIVKGLNTPFYLTGGTALSRHYFKHRFSDDLDLFVNNDNSYGRYVESIFQELEKQQQPCNFLIDYQSLRRSASYTRLLLLKRSEGMETQLRIELVNDIAAHYGDFEHDENLGRIDSWRNILSNKLSAVFRYEAKDFADIWMISKRKNFSWVEIVKEAKTKEAGVDPIALYEILKSFPRDVISTIKWNITINEDDFLKDLSSIAEDIFKGRINSLCTGKA